MAAYFEQRFVEDAKTLRLRNYQNTKTNNLNLHPHATKHIPKILKIIQILIKQKYTYLNDTKQVYFEVSRFKKYNQLSNKIIKNLEANTHITIQDEKKNPQNFALW